MQKISEIKEEIQKAQPEEYNDIYKKYAEDTRSGVAKLLLQLHKKEEAYQRELVRTEKMKESGVTQRPMMLSPRRPMGASIAPFPSGSAPCAMA